MARAHQTVVAGLALLLCLTACRSAVPPAPHPVEDAGEYGDGASRRSAREAWFVRQRLYPFASFEEDVRAKAFRAMRTMETRAAGTAAGGAGWVPLGPAPTDSRFPDAWQRTSGRIRSVAVSPADPSIVLIGTSSGGIWRSTDQGETFVPASDDQADLSVASIVFSPSSPSIVYAGMGGEFLGSGVLKSTDAGATWRRVDEQGLPPMAQAARIAVHPTNPEIVLLAQAWKLVDDGTTAASQLFQSIDGGRTWTARLGDFPTDVVFDPAEPSIAYTALPTLILENRPPTIYRSLDAGTTWEPAFAPSLDTSRYMTIRLAVAPARPGRIYAYAYGGLGTFLYVSDDHGETWREQPIEGVRGRAVLFETDPENGDVLYIGQFVDLFRSTD
ncbi:MAG: WD40/YVTN/BNR-like repeat-containing protein, partial [Thermoanaerobaculia bacterium]